MKAKVLTIHTNRTFFYALVVISIVSTALYAYGISRAIHNVAQRQGVEQQLSSRLAEVSDLEFQYLTLKNNVDMKLALSMGFLQTDKAHFVSRSTGVAYAGKEVAAR